MSAAGEGRTAAARGPFGLYVHWPYCLSKCPYCDFNSHVAGGAVDHDAWRRAYLAELDALAARWPGRRLDTVFFGGGTPSLMAPATAAAVIGRALELWPPAPGAPAPEITLEANPTSVESGRFADFAAAGVNRVSLGIQALDDEALAFLGRGHSAAEALEALATARARFGRVSADMIYARPGQTVAAWRRELDRLLAEGLGHLSLYQLTVERGTPFFGAHRKGAFTLPDEDAAADLYEATGAALARAGLAAYEVSNYAVPGEECRHNLIYWRCGEYAGLGPGAHGRRHEGAAAVATENLRRPGDWLAAVRAVGHGLRGEHALTPRARLDEMMMMGLRLAEGVPETAFRTVSGGGFADALDRRRLDRLSEAGLIARGDGRLAATAEGRLRLDAVLAELLA